MTTPNKTVMLEISNACGEAMHSGGVYTFFDRLAAICDEPLKKRLETAIADSRGKLSLASARTAKLDGASVWWLKRLSAPGWETEVSKSILLKSYMDGVKQFRISPGRHAYVLETLLESLCPVFEEFVQRVELSEEEQATLRGAEDRDMRIQCYRFPGLVQARICWENAYGPTDWPDGMGLADAQYDEERAAIQATLDAQGEQRDRAARDDARASAPRHERHGD